MTPLDVMLLNETCIFFLCKEKGVQPDRLLPTPVNRNCLWRRATSSPKLEVCSGFRFD